MKLLDVVAQPYRTLMQYQPDYRAVLLHPDSRYRSVVVAQLLNDPDIKTYYYALGPDDVSLQSFVDNVAHDLIKQKPSFGRYLHLMPHYVYGNFSQHKSVVIDAFVQELNALESEPYVLVLDEYDRSDEADDIHSFMYELITRLPDHCKLVINSRTLPRLPWLALSARRDAIILKDNTVINSDIYERGTSENHDLEVRAFGPGTVTRNGEAIDAWEGHLPRLLLFFTLDRPVVTRAEICDNFWSELDIDQAVNVFHVTKRRLHKALDLDILVHEGTHYRINPEINVYCDMIKMVEALAKARETSGEEAVPYWKRVIQLYRGQFLEGHTDDWIVSRRTAFQHGYIEALTSYADWLQQDSNPEQALKLYEQVLEADYSRESIHHALMTLYNKLGRRSEAVAHYQAFQQYAETNELTISSHLSDLHDQIVKG